MLKKLISAITNKKQRTIYLAILGFYNNKSDEDFLKMQFKNVFGYELDLENPQTFSEKLQWLKLYDRNPLYTTLVDKAAVKDYVAEKIGAEYIIPTIGVWDNFDEIDFDSLPNQFVLKCTHDSGGLVICKDKSKLNLRKAKRKIEKSLKRNYYDQNREWPYKNVKPRILAEKYMEDGNSGDSLSVYKIMTFGGEPKIIQTIQNDKKANETIDYFDCEWNLLDLKQNFPNSATPLSRPKKLDTMLALARKMSEGFAFLRVDFYEINEKVYFSEYTFYSDSGLAKFTPAKWDKILGDSIVLTAKAK